MREYVYTSYDNDIRVRFFINGVEANLSTATKFSIEFFAKKSDRNRDIAPVAEFNSIDNPTMFDITNILNGEVVFKPGPSDLSPLSVETYYTRWIVFDIIFDDGLVWGNDLIKYIVAR